MIDWHSHVLPSMDDGSRDVEESVSMLRALAEQGIDTVVATPHFYANDESVESFIERRAESFKTLKAALDDNAPRILLGAEVRYYAGIGRMTELSRLAIESTRLVLIEMPMTRWTEYTVKELIELAGTSRLTVVLAHIERYFALQDKDVWRRLAENGVLMQVNASAFNGFAQRRKMIKLLQNGMLHFIGSDCHNMTSRPPKISGAYEDIKTKCGEMTLSRINEFGYNKIQNK